MRSWLLMRQARRPDCCLNQGGHRALRTGACSRRSFRTISGLVSPNQDQLLLLALGGGMTSVARSPPGAEPCLRPDGEFQHHASRALAQAPGNRDVIWTRGNGLWLRCFFLRRGLAFLLTVTTRTALY